MNGIFLSTIWSGSVLSLMVCSEEQVGAQQLLRHMTDALALQRLRGALAEEKIPLMTAFQLVPSGCGPPVALPLPRHLPLPPHLIAIIEGQAQKYEKDEDKLAFAFVQTTSADPKKLEQLWIDFIQYLDTQK